MDEHGQVYFGAEDEVPDADKKRLEEAEYERLRVEAQRAMRELRELADG